MKCVKVCFHWLLLMVVLIKSEVLVSVLRMATTTRERLNLLRTCLGREFFRWLPCLKKDWVSPLLWQTTQTLLLSVKWLTVLPVVWKTLSWLHWVLVWVAVSLSTVRWCMVMTVLQVNWDTLSPVAMVVFAVVAVRDVWKLTVRLPV